MVRNKVARPARIPTIHFVMLLITWSIDATASTWPAVPARAGCAAAVRAAAAPRAVAAVVAAGPARGAGCRAPPAGGRPPPREPGPLGGCHATPRGLCAALAP